MSTINSPLTIEDQQRLYEAGVRIYEKDGQTACEEFATANGINETAECDGCESEEPVVMNADGSITCFVCGSSIETEN